VPDQILAAYAALHLPNPAAGAQGICQYQTLLSCRSPVRTVLNPTPEASPVTHGRPASPHERTARHRTTQRARGLRQVGLWLPDVTNPPPIRRASPNHTAASPT